MERMMMEMEMETRASLLFHEPDQTIRVLSSVKSIAELKKKNR